MRVTKEKPARRRVAVQSRRYEGNERERESTIHLTLTLLLYFPAASPRSRVPYRLCQPRLRSTQYPSLSDARDLSSPIEEARVDPVEQTAETCYSSASQ